MCQAKWFKRIEKLLCRWWLVSVATLPFVIELIMCLKKTEWHFSIIIFYLKIYLLFKKEHFIVISTSNSSKNVMQTCGNREKMIFL
jgi:hypothetical protein